MPDITFRFRTSCLVTHRPSAWHEAWDRSCVCAHVMAIEDDTPRNGGPLSW